MVLPKPTSARNDDRESADPPCPSRERCGVRIEIEIENETEPKKTTTQHPRAGQPLSFATIID
eukprot:jgi/Psemu1/60902/gm1.60902_g